MMAELTVEAKLAHLDEVITFNPLLMEEPDITKPLEERKIGGMGIFLVKKIMDEVNYKFVDAKNILSIKKIIMEDDQ